MTIPRMTNKQKADVFFKVAMEELDLMLSDGMNQRLQVNPVAPFYTSSSYICDGLVSVVDSGEVIILQEDMKLFGLPHTGHGAFNSVEAERRQEARWFFLMLMVEYLDNE